MRTIHCVGGVALCGLVCTLTLLVPSPADGWQQNERLWSAPWSWVGPAPAARVGYDVACGDLNGDGIDDLAFSAPFDTTDGEWGTVYVVFGSPSGWQPELPLTGVASFKGESIGDHPGWSLAVVPSVNGDAFDDLVIGAPDNDESDEGAGKVYFVFGKATGWGQGVSLSEADASYVGVGFNHKAGFSVASAGDVNGDGRGDVLVGAPFGGRGRVYLILGKATGWGTSVPLSSAEASFLGETSFPSMPGFSLDGVGDLNGDGLDELLVGAPKFSTDSLFIGKAYLFLGRSAGWVQNDTLSHADKSFLGSLSGDEMGTCVAGAGDVDHDGKGDFLVSTPTGTGTVTLWRGSQYATWGQNTPPESASTRILGSYASTGAAMGALGDVNGDLFDDFAVGSPDWGAGYGKAYAIFGRAAASWPSQMDIETAQASWQGVGHKDWAGRAVTGGDVNHDGRPDLVLGVDGSPFAGYDAGIVYVIPSTYGFDSTPPAMVTGFQAEVDLIDSSSVISWNAVSLDQNGGAEQVLFYRALRYRYPSSALHAQLPAVLHPQHALADTGWVPWNTAQSDTTAFFDEYDYYRLLAIDAYGNASMVTPRLSVFQVVTDIP